MTHIHALYRAPTDARRWNEAVDAPLGDWIATLVRLYGGEPRLDRPSKDLPARTHAALDAIRLARSGITVVSAADPAAPEALLARLSGHARTFAARDPRDLLARSILWSYGAQIDDIFAERFMPPLEKAIGIERAASIFRHLWVTIVRRPTPSARERYGQLADIILAVRMPVIAYLVGFTIAGDEETAAAFRSFASLFDRGHYGLGTLSDGTFAVLTA